MLKRGFYTAKASVGMVEWGGNHTFDHTLNYKPVFIPKKLNFKNN